MSDSTPTGDLFARIAAVARARGAADCWIVPGRDTWSYAEVLDGAERFAARLAALGVERGDRVLVQVGKSPEALLLYLACLACGAVFVPLNPAYTPAEVRYFASDCTPRLMVCDPRSAAEFARIAAATGAGAVATLDAQGGGSLLTPGGATGTMSVHQGSRRCEDAVDGTTPRAAERIRASSPAGSRNLAAILYTSGTTGRSKGAMLSHGNLLSNALALIDLWRFTPADVLIHVLPVHHVHGLFVATHCALLSGAATVLLPKLEVGAVLDWLPHASVFMGVPTHYTRLLADARFDRTLTARMRLFVSGSAPLLPATFAEFEARTGQRILERYGMTEAGMIASNPYEGDRIAGTVGFALPGVVARIADGQGRELPHGAAGVLEIRGPGVFQGYWRQPEKTAAEFRTDGCFITGDVATMDATGRIAIVGRAKDLIISGGFNIYPREIELEIDALPGVVESAVVGVPHPDFGEGVIAVVVRAAGATLGETQVIEALHARLARFKQPKRVFFVGELPRNTMGKVQKSALRERFAGAFGGSA